MKKFYILGAALIVVIAIVSVSIKQGEARVLNVNEVGADPAAYAGTIVITGVMGATSAEDPTLFGIMDLKELKCPVKGCNKLFIPVKHQGKQPALGDEVKVTGSFTKVDGGLVFTAMNVEVVRNHKIGG